MSQRNWKWERQRFSAWGWQMGSKCVVKLKLNRPVQKQVFGLHYILYNYLHY